MSRARSKEIWAETDTSPLPASVQRALSTYEQEDLSWLKHPGDGGYPLDSDACRFLQALVPRLPGQSILEFGSGLSTAVLARAVQGLGLPSPRVVSVEGVSRYRDLTAEFLSTLNLGSVAEVHHCPVRLNRFGGRLLYFYDIPEPAAAAHAPYDLVLVDGPPGYIGREASLYFSLALVRPGALLVLDDAARVQWEQRWLARWQAALGEHVTIWLLPQFKSGLAVVQIHDPQALLRFPPSLIVGDLLHIMHRIVSNLKARLLKAEDA